jgi:hypothetical protein
MPTTIYADGIANIQLIDGIVRLDLVNMGQVDKDKVTLKPVGSVALSLPALLRTYDQLSSLINALVDKGLLAKNTSKDPVSEDLSGVAKTADDSNKKLN